MRIISFAWTTQAFLAGTKTVTRRMWKECNVKPGDLMQAWDKSPRAKGKRVGTIKILKVDREPLHDFLQHGEEELKREGGLWKTDGEFIAEFLRANPDMLATDSVWRIEFERHRETHTVAICHADIVDKQGDSFSANCLAEIAKGKVPPLISKSFDQAGPVMGQVKRLFVQGNSLNAEILIDPYLLESHVFRPGGEMVTTHQTVSDGKDVRVIDKMNLHDIGAVERSNDVY